MIKRLAAFIFALFAFAVSATSVPALDVMKLGDPFHMQFEDSSKSQATKMLSGNTFLLKLKGIPGSVGKLLPISGIVVFYFAPNGQLLGWSDKSGNVEAGKWIVDAPAGSKSKLCFAFPESKGAAFCLTSFWLAQPFMEEVKGNPFGLKAEKPAPYKLGRFGVSLSGIAKKLGM